EIGAAVGPTSGNNYVVMSNDFRENYDHMFYHVSTTNGATWTDETPLAMRPGPPSFSLAKTKIVSPLAIRLPPYIVFCALNAKVSARRSLTSALIANIMHLVSRYSPSLLRNAAFRSSRSSLARTSPNTPGEGGDVRRRLRPG